MSTEAGIPGQVGVLGGGRMGAGVAHGFVLAGAEVVVVERDEQSAGAARERVESSLATTVERDGSAGNLAELTARLSVSTDYSSFAGCGLVVEAVPEDMKLKIAALTAVETQLGDGAWLASNTSSLSVTALAGALLRPERFCGLHFFNPVPASLLVEVVLAKTTSPELAGRARQWVEALGKTPVVVNDAPGFASSRLGVVIALEAIRMVEEGVASPADIDAAMVLGYKFPVGPLRLTDIVGLDVRLGIAEYLHSTLGERFAPPALMQSMVARGDLGRKSGRGFYDWNVQSAQREQGGR
jgi:3-hydroxybutyryl-CoA dehydrogenase